MVQIQKKTSVSGVNQIKSSPDAERGSSINIFSQCQNKGNFQKQIQQKRHRVFHPYRTLSSSPRSKRNKTSKSLQKQRTPHSIRTPKTRDHFGKNSRETQMYQMYARHKAQIQKSRKSRHTRKTVRRDQRKRKHIANKSPWNHAAQSWWEQSGIIGEQI